MRVELLSSMAGQGTKVLVWTSDDEGFRITRKKEVFGRAPFRKLYLVCTILHSVMLTHTSHDSLVLSLEFFLP